MAKSVIVTEYDAAWPEWFARLRDAVWPAVADIAVSIEHVGSTAVPGLPAKPVIDLDVVIRGPGDLPAVIERLAGLGYRHRGDLGIEGREAFRAPADAPIAHHLYVCAADSLALRNHILLRDHLRAHPSDAAAYGDLKRSLAKQHAEDAERYVEGKTDFILGVLRRHGVAAGELTTIEAANVRSAQR